MPQALLFLIAVAALVFTPLEAGASPAQLKLESGAATMVIVDNSAEDGDPSTGVVFFSDSFDVFGIVVAVGMSKPVLGTPSQPEMNVTVLSMTQATGGTLTVSFTDTGFNSGAGATTLTSATGGTTQGQTTVQSYVDPGNVEFGTACTSGSQGPLSGAYDSTTTGPCSLSGDFSMTAVSVFTLGAGQLQSHSVAMSLPPPALSCGDGTITPPETCDPPGTNGGQANECRDDCTFCGDFMLDTGHGEECDDGNNVDGDGCSANCVEEICGDGMINLPGETCDPPGEPSGQPNECRDNCTFCGDFVLDTAHGEECDDGNNVGGDGCEPTCLLPICGDGSINQPGETCDPPGSTPPGQSNICRVSCTYCGDFIVNNGEKCDNGTANNLPGSGCEPDCTLTPPPVCDLMVAKTADPKSFVPSPQPDCETLGKPTSLTFEYTADGCAASDNDQDPKKVNCQEVGTLGVLDVTVSAFGMKKGDVKPYDAAPTVVSPGDQFTITPQGDKFESQSFLTATNADGMEENEFHTSCSQPLAVGDIFGSFTLVAFNGVTGSADEVTYDYWVTNNGSALTGILLEDDKLELIAGPFDLDHGDLAHFTETATITETTTNTATATGWLSNFEMCEAEDSATVIVEVPPVSCADGKPQVLMMIYTGEDCSATSHTQDPDKVSCDGDPSFTGPVRIRATDKENPFDSKAKVWFDDDVALNELFGIDATNAGEIKLKAATFVTIWGGTGTVLQTLEFHTSCSQPLNVGDQFGSLILDQFIPEP